MAAVTVTALKCKPLPGALIRDFIAAEAIDVGELVYINSSGLAALADGSAAGTANGLGVVVSAGTLGYTSAAIGDAISVVYFGPVTGFSGMTPGARHYVSDTAGALDTAAGTVTKVMGVALAADILMIIHNM